MDRLGRLSCRVAAIVVMAMGTLITELKLASADFVAVIVQLPGASAVSVAPVIEQLAAPVATWNVIVPVPDPPVALRVAELPFTIIALEVDRVSVDWEVGVIVMVSAALF